MKIKYNKKLLAVLLAAGMTFSITSCGSAKGEEITGAQNASYETNDIQSQEEQDNNYEERYLLQIANLEPSETYITTSDGLTIPLSNYKSNKLGEYFIIPEEKCTISYTKDSKTYSHDIKLSNNRPTVVTVNDRLFIYDTFEDIDYNELQSILEESNIKLNDDFSGKIKYITKRNGYVFDEYDKIQEHSAIYLNDKEIYSKITDDNNNTYYNSILNRGDGINTIGVEHDGEIYANYICDYTDDYSYMENMENNINYFFNKINSTDNIDYYTGGEIDLSSLVQEGVTIRESINKFKKDGEEKLEYAYTNGDNLIISFGQYGYTDSYYINDQFGFVNQNIVNNEYIK